MQFKLVNLSRIQSLQINLEKRAEWELSELAVTQTKIFSCMKFLYVYIMFLYVYNYRYVHTYIQKPTDTTLKMVTLMKKSDEVD